MKPEYYTTLVSGVLVAECSNGPFPYSQTFEFGKSIIQLSRLVAQYFKMWKIQSCKVGEFYILLYYERKSVTTMW